MAETGAITGIDHPIIAVRDMAAGRAAYERLGFTVTPRGRHTEWGTGNWCIMFEHDYLELRGIIDPKNPHNLDRVLAVREGLMGIALGTNDAEASFAALSQRGLNPQPVKQLTREFELPEGAVHPRFSLCFPGEGDTPGLMSVVFCQHMTPELLRRPEWLRHANGTLGFRKITGVVSNISAAAEAHAKVFGKGAITQDHDRLTIRVGDLQEIELMTPDAARQTWAGNDGWLSDSGDWLHTLSLTVRNLAETERYLAAKGVKYQRSSAGSLGVDSREACGVPLEFCSTI